MNEIMTPRLCLRRFMPADLPYFVQYRNDAQLAQYQTWGAMDETTARIFIEDMSTAPIDGAMGLQIAVALRENNMLIGDCYVRVSYGEQAEIGYTLARSYHGHGYATEAVRAVISYGFGNMGLHRIYANVACANLRSVALLERLGLRREAHFKRSFRYGGVWQDEYQYAVLRDEWGE